MLASAAASGVAIGLGVHATSQIIEPPLVATIRLHCIALFGSFIFFYKQQSHSFILSTAEGISLAITYVLTLTTSIAIYRLYFHRLRLFPGDTLNILTNLSWIPIDWHGNRTSRLQALHSRYGTVVRIGPREVSIANANAFKMSNGCSEGPRYHAQIFAQSPMSPADQARLRKGSKRRSQAIKDVSNDLEKHLTPLQGLVEDAITRLKEKADLQAESIDIAPHIHRFSIRAATLLGTGKSIESEEEEKMIEPIDEQIRMLYTLASVPYCIEAVRLIPSATRVFDMWINSSLQSRNLNDTSTFASMLVTKEKDTLVSDAVHTADIRSFILQTSAAVTSILTFCLLELLDQPECMKRLVQEIQQSSTSTASLYGLPFLDACFDETLRLYPPVPIAMQKVTPPGGIEIDKKIRLPGNVIFSVPSFLLHRDPSHFSSPNDFDPTRWLKRESKASHHQITALCPFGVEESISESLVLMQCRMYLVELLRHFQVQSSSSSSSSSQMSATSNRRAYRDQHIVARTLCNVVISRRTS